MKTDLNNLLACLFSIFLFWYFQFFIFIWYYKYVI